MFNWFKKENKSNKEIAIEKFKKVGLTFEEADYLAQDIAELSLFADNSLFDEEDNVSSLSEAYNDKYYMFTVDSIIDNDSPIKDIAYTGILARDRGLNFEVRTAIKNSIFEYLDKSNLDNSNFKEAFIQTLETVELNLDKDIKHEYAYEDIDTEIKLNYISTIETTLGVEFDVTEDINNVKTKSIDFTKKILKINGEEVPHFVIRDNTLTKRSWFAGKEGEVFSMLISVEPNDKKVQFTVFVPTIVEGIKPSVQTFSYTPELELKDFPI